MVTQEIVGCGRLQVGIDIAVVTLAPAAAPADVAAEQAAQETRLGAHLALPFWIAHLGPVGLVGQVVETQCVAVREDERPLRQGQVVGVGQQADTGRSGKILTQRKIAAPDELPNLWRGAAVRCCTDLAAPIQ